MNQLLKNRSLLIVLAVIVVILATRLVPVFYRQTTGRVDPHVSLAEDRLRQISETQHQQQMVAFQAVTEGEVFRTEQRIREATALAAALSIVAAAESLNGRSPADSVELLNGVSRDGMMPPGLQAHESGGGISGANGHLVVRYRMAPLGIEVLSIGNAPLDGPVVLVRVPSSSSSHVKNKMASIFIANTLELTRLPAPFSSEAEILVLGFESAPMRDAKVQ